MAVTYFFNQYLINRNKNTYININSVFKRHFGVSGSWGYSIFAREGKNDSNVKKQNLQKFENKEKRCDVLKIKNFHFTKWPGQVSKLGASYFFNKKWNTGFYHMLIEEETETKTEMKTDQHIQSKGEKKQEKMKVVTEREIENKKTQCDFINEKQIRNRKIKKDIVLLSSCNRYQVENKKIENQMKDLTCGYSVQIILSGKGAKCYYEDVLYSPVKNSYRNDIKQYYSFRNGMDTIQKLEDTSIESREQLETEKEKNKINVKESKKENSRTKKIKKLFVRLGIGTKNIDITRILTMHKKYVNIDVDKTGTIITVYGYNKKYVGSVSHRLYKVVKMNVYTMKGGYVYLHKPKQKIPKKK